jgi:uncharacterized protein (DUF1778 family)
MVRSTNRTVRVTACMTQDVLNMLRHAAELQGRSLNDFIVAAAREAAHRAIEEALVVRLSVDGQQRFAEALLNPPAPSSALRRAMQRHRQLVGEL